MKRETQAKRLYSQAPESGQNQVLDAPESARQRAAQVKPSKGKAKPQSTVSTTVPQLTQPDGCKSKNRPHWRIALTSSGGKGARFPGYQSRYGDGNPSRRQCVALARSTGVRCRCDACHGAPTCRLHGGIRIAARAAGITVTLATLRRRRVALASIGAMPAPDGFPLDAPWQASPVDRGALYEAWQNRALAPGEWNLALTKARNRETRNRG